MLDQTNITPIKINTRKIQNKNQNTRRDTPCYKQFLPGLEEPGKSADAEKSEILRMIDKVEILHRGQSDPALQKTFLSVAPFRVQISPKYFHSLKLQNHMKFNSSQIFEAHPSTSLLKFLLTPLLLFPLFIWSPNTYQK